MDLQREKYIFITLSWTVSKKLENKDYMEKAMNILIFLKIILNIENSASIQLSISLVRLANSSISNQ